MTTRQAVIVTRHEGLVEWLRQRGIAGEVISHATENDVRDREVYGALPLHLAALAASVVVVDLPNLLAEHRGKDLTPAEMDAVGATMTRYVVTKEEGAPR